MDNRTSGGVDEERRRFHQRCKLQPRTTRDLSEKDLQTTRAADRVNLEYQAPQPQ